MRTFSFAQSCRKPGTRWVALLIGILALLTVGSLMAIRKAPVRLTWRVARFHLHLVRLTHLTDERRYFIGNPTLAEIREFLRLKMHLPLRPGQSLSPKEVLPELRPLWYKGISPEPAALAISFRLDGGTRLVPRLRLNLTDKAGHSFSCGGVLFAVRTNECVGVWDLDQGRSGGGPYEAEIRNENTPLAEFHLRYLPPVSADDFP
jgi:hypothetical protein